ncbi:MAG: protein TonB [Porticoccus sp.]|jgi:protein TonB|tara:strand:+ start:4684 stop:5376 length:693 start_codon:yes stop_codon:yes gene_type:complete
MLAKLKDCLSRFNIKDALFLSMLIHGILITDLLILKFDKAESSKELMNFEAILLSKSVLEPSPPLAEKASEEADSKIVEEFEPEITKDNIASIQEEITPVEPESVQQQQESAVSAPEPVETPEVGEDDARNAGLAALDDFSRQFAMHVAQYKKYPRIAQRRGWQGEVVLQVKLTHQGKLITKELKKSSGFKALDKEGLDMIDRAAPFPAPPSILSGKIFTILVPIKFTLL